MIVVKDLDKLREDGLVATDRQGKVIFSNRAAWELLGMEDWPEARDFHYTVEDGRVTAVTLTGTLDDAETGRGTPEGYVPLIVMALTFGREESAFWYWPRRA